MYFIVEWAFNHGKLPSDVYQEYLQHPKDFQLLAEYRNYKVEKENKAHEKAKAPLGKKTLGGNQPPR